MVRIGEQQHGGLQRADFDDLADHAAGVDHRLAGAHALAAAGAQQQALTGGIQVDIQHRRQLHVEAALLRRGQQAAQPCVVGVDRDQPRHAGAADQQFVAQAAVLGSELAQRAGVVGHGFDQAPRQAGNGAHRLDQDLRLLPRATQPAAAVVEHDQHEGESQVRQ